MKKCLVMLLVLIVLASIPVTAFADNTVYTEGTLYYTIGDETITIVGCFGKKEVIYVPNNIGGIPVNTIASGAFTGNKYLKTLYLPDTISTVEGGAIGGGISVVYNYNTENPSGTPTDLIQGTAPETVPAEEGAIQSTPEPESGTQPEQGQGTGTPAQEPVTEVSSGTETLGGSAPVSGTGGTAVPQGGGGIPATTTVEGTGEVIVGDTISEGDVSLFDSSDEPIGLPDDAETEPAEQTAPAGTEADQTKAPAEEPTATAAPAAQEVSREAESPRARLLIIVILALALVAVVVIAVATKGKKKKRKPAGRK